MVPPLGAALGSHGRQNLTIRGTPEFVRALFS
jgi:hypothetical protein